MHPVGSQAVIMNPLSSLKAKAVSSKNIKALTIAAVGAPSEAAFEQAFPSPKWEELCKATYSPEVKIVPNWDPNPLKGLTLDVLVQPKGVVDDKGQVVEPEKTPGGSASSTPRPVGPAELKPGQQRKEMEGVFVVADGRAKFVPVKTGIAGEKYFEVLSGLKAGDEVITGPFASVRNLKEGDLVRTTTTTPTPTAVAK